MLSLSLLFENGPLKNKMFYSGLRSVCSWRPALSAHIFYSGMQRQRHFSSVQGSEQTSLPLQPVIKGHYKHYVIE